MRISIGYMRLIPNERFKIPMGFVLVWHSPDYSFYSVGGLDVYSPTLWRSMDIVKETVERE
jgi:hypothetical protein